MKHERHKCTEHALKGQANSLHYKNIKHCIQQVYVLETHQNKLVPAKGADVLKRRKVIERLTDNNGSAAYCWVYH